MAVRTGAGSVDADMDSVAADADGAAISLLASLAQLRLASSECPPVASCERV